MVLSEEVKPRQKCTPTDDDNYNAGVKNWFKKTESRKAETRFFLRMN